MGTASRENEHEHEHEHDQDKENLSVNPNPVELIARLRRRPPGERAYTDRELFSLVSSYTEGRLPDYQMAAWLMAVCFRPLTPPETAVLTKACAASGRVLAWPSRKDRPPLVDKHSTGGVGDKVSLVLAPLVATCGVAVPMIAGRGLGHTGGTIDKLETTFEGYRAELGPEDFAGIVLGGKRTGISGASKGASTSSGGASIAGCAVAGCAIAEAGPEICPADRKIYALRDVTATVSCPTLQTASILSKKIAERPDSLVLDVKFGDGAFQPTVEEAAELARSLVATGEESGLLPTTAFLTRMDRPLGRAVGNAVEVAECIDVMKGGLEGRKRTGLRLSGDLIALVVVLAGQMLYQSAGPRGEAEEGGGGNGMSKSSNGNGTTEASPKASPKASPEASPPADASTTAAPPHPCYSSMSLDECIAHAYRVLDSGRVLPTFRTMLLAQGAEAGPLDRALSEGAFPRAAFSSSWIHRGGTLCLSDVPARAVGEAAVLLGAGRTNAGAAVDGAAGLLFARQAGDLLEDGDTVVTVYTDRSPEAAEAALDRVRRAVVLGPPTDQGAAASGTPVVTHRVTSGRGVEPFAMPGFLRGGGGA